MFWCFRVILTAIADLLIDCPPNNSAILNIAHIKNVMSSATEAELAALCIMAREAVYTRSVLEELGHKQPPTPDTKTNQEFYGRSSSKWQSTT